MCLISPCKSNLNPHECVTGGERGRTAQFHSKVWSESCPMGVLVLRAAQPVPGCGCEPGTWNLESSRPSLSTVLLRAGLESPWMSQMSALFHLGICSDCRHQRPCGVPAPLLHTEGSVVGSSDSHQQFMVVLSQDVTPGVWVPLHCSPGCTKLGAAEILQCSKVQQAQCQGSEVQDCPESILRRGGEGEEETECEISVISFSR